MSALPEQTEAHAALDDADVAALELTVISVDKDPAFDAPPRITVQAVPTSWPEGATTEDLVALLLNRSFVPDQPDE